jgi:hypothetical protein
MWDIHAVPAYGRDYKSKEAVLADWKAGKDFKAAAQGYYFSIRDVEKIGAEIWIRYDKLRKIMRVH